MKAVVAAFNQEKALVGAFSVITNLRMELRLKLYQLPCQQQHYEHYWHSSAERSGNLFGENFGFCLSEAAAAEPQQREAAPAVKMCPRYINP